MGGVTCANDRLPEVEIRVRCNGFRGAAEEQRLVETRSVRRGRVRAKRWVTTLQCMGLSVGSLTRIEVRPRSGVCMTVCARTQCTEIRVRERPVESHVTLTQRSPQIANVCGDASSV